MSVKVDLDRLADELANYSFAYLVTVGDDFHAHTVAIEPVFADGVFHVGPVGSTTSRNLASHDSATLVWPPSEPSGYTLIVDGRADSQHLVPDRAVLHRKGAPGAATESACKDDCRPLYGD
jgi:hypothetical protein